MRISVKTGRQIKYHYPVSFTTCISSDYDLKRLNSKYKFYIFRLYYLFNGPKLKFVKEESVINFLIVSAPFTSVLFTTLYLVENVAINGLGSSPCLFFFSYCGKTPFYPNVVSTSIVFLVYGLVCITCLVSGMCCQVVIFLKHTRIESKASVYVLKDNQIISSQRHHRNVVSFMGHFVSFIITMAQFSLLLNTYYFFLEDEEMLATMRTLLYYFSPAIEFFIHPMVETIFSESLRGTFCLSSIW